MSCIAQLLSGATKNNYWSGAAFGHSWIAIMQYKGYGPSNRGQKPWQIINESDHDGGMQ